MNFIPYYPKYYNISTFFSMSQYDIDDDLDTYISFSLFKSAQIF